MGETTDAKYISLGVILAVGGIFSLIPIHSKIFHKSAKYTSYANVFAAGVFLAIGFAHLLPETDEKYKGINDDHYPLVYVLALCGFSVILLFEKVAGQYLHTHDPTHATATTVLAQTLERSASHKEGKDVAPKSEKADLYKNGESTEAICRQTEECARNADMEMNKADNDEDEKHICADKHVVDTHGNHAHHTHAHTEAAHHAHYHEEHENLAKMRFASAIILAVALSIHSIFAGLSLGLQDTRQGVYELFVAVVAHKWAASLSLGIQLDRSAIDKTYATAIACFFACTTPLGK